MRTRASCSSTDAGLDSAETPASTIPELDNFYETLRAHIQSALAAGPYPNAKALLLMTCGVWVDDIERVRAELDVFVGAVFVSLQRKDQRASPSTGQLWRRPEAVRLGIRTLPMALRALLPVPTSDRKPPNGTCDNTVVTEMIAAH